MRIFFIVFALCIAEKIFPGFSTDISVPTGIFIGVCMGLSLIADFKDAFS